MFENRIEELRKQADRLQAFEGVFDVLKNEVRFNSYTDDDGNDVPPTPDDWRYDRYMAFIDAIDILEKAIQKKYF